MENQKFKGCRFLDFSDKVEGVIKVLDTRIDPFVYWDRTGYVNNIFGKEDRQAPRKVQFCTKRGRLNSPIACVLSEGNKRCPDYDEIEYDISELILNPAL